MTTLRHRLYYALKPYVPWRVRMAIRRTWAMRQRRMLGSVWPIYEPARRPPDHWPGWPDGKQFAFLASHDVEGPEGAARCRRLAELEMSLGFRSSFNLVPEGSYAPDPGLRQWLVENGFEVGVHDLHHDGELYRSRAAFRESAARINAYLKEWNCSGFRSGFMLHDLDWIHDLDIAYDSSTFDTDPFEPQPEGVGTIFPFWVPPTAAGRRGYIELPYTLPQDSTLFLLLRETSPEIWIRKLDWVAAAGGMALVNVHPDYLQFPDEKPRERSFPVAHYVRLLEHVRDRHAGQYWQALPAEAAREAAAVRPVHRRKKRICMVTYSFFERDTRVFRYGEALAQRGDEVDVISLRSSPALPREEMVKGCRVIRLQDRTIDEKVLASFLQRLLAFFWRASRWITRSHARRPYDLIHVHNVPDFLVFAAWRPKWQGAKIILDIHDVVPELFGSKFRRGPGSFMGAVMFRLLVAMERASAAFADHVILANHLWVENYSRRSARPEKITVLLNYVDSRIFFSRPRLRQDGRQIVIFPGSLQTHQGLDVALRAFPAVVAAVPSAELHIYGEGPAKPALKRLAVELGLNGHVKFFGFVPTTEIAAVMADADLGVVPKRADSFGNEAFSTKILEFMSLGIPVVASSTRIDRYYFDDSVLRFFESGNSETLARGIVELLQDPDAARQMAARASAHAARNSWEHHKPDYLGLVDRLCPPLFDHGLTPPESAPAPSLAHAP